MNNLVGQTILNRYRVDAFIDKGGMAIVYKVWDLEMNAPLAMKVLDIDLAENPSILKLFEREARALKRLAHPYIVPFYGFHHTDDLIFMVEQYIDGLTLKELLKRQPRRQLNINEALIYLKVLCTALGYAHANGVVHCDVKPANMMVDRTGSIYLTDFGIARHADSATTTIADAGSAAYMAPEQIRGEPVTATADIYALGITLFEMLTGRLPFKSEEVDSEKGSGSGATGREIVKMAQLNTPPPDPRLFNPQIPAELAQVILQSLAKDPRQRYQSVTGLFQAACASVGLAPDQVNDHVAPLTLPVPAPIPAPTPGKRSSRLPIWGWASIGAAALVALCASGIFLGRYLSSVTATPTTAPNRPLMDEAITPTNTLPPPSPTPTDTPLPTPTDTPVPTDTPIPTDTPRPTEPPIVISSPATTMKIFVKNIRREAIYVYVNGTGFIGILSLQIQAVGVPGLGNVTLKWCDLDTNTWKVGGHCRTKTYNITAAGQNIALGY